MTADQISAEGYDHLIKVLGNGAAGVGPQLDMLIDTEGDPDFTDNSSGSGIGSLTGRLRIAGLFPLDGVSVPYPTGLKIEAVRQPAGPVTPPSYTSATPFQNPFWRDALVTIAGGTVTGIKTGATMGGSSAPSMTDTGLTAGTFLVPSGGWLEITESEAPTVTWTLI